MKYTTLALINDNYKKVFRSLVKQLKNQGLTIIQATDGCYDNLVVNKDTDILDIMEHCFSCEDWSLLVQDNKGNTAMLSGHLDGCVESFIHSYGIHKQTNLESYMEFESKIEKANDSFNEINQDIELY